jgi:hypothetical protein
VQGAHADARVLSIFFKIIDRKKIAAGSVNVTSLLYCPYLA